MAQQKHIHSIAIIGTFLIVLTCVQPILSVISIRPGGLSKDEYLKLDFEVSKFYDSKDLDQNVTFDEQLFRSIRAFRHTITMDLHDFRYSSRKLMKNSMGKSVNLERCRRQLDVLVKIASKMMNRQAVPLSAIDFLGSNGQTGAGILNGNLFWPGSHSSCTRAKVKYTNQNQDDTIYGRYCLAHLRAKSWPKKDLYFNDRLTLRKGLCLPEPCHSYLYETSAEIQQAADLLNRFNLLEPFNGSNYETSHLFCPPDGDSLHRQPDFGARMFIAFCCLWLLITMYANYRYYQRAEALKRLHNAVDIKMVISERRFSSDEDDEDLIGSCVKSGPVDGDQATNNLQVSSSLFVPSANSSASVTPVPSDAEDAVDEFNVLLKLIRKNPANEAKVTAKKLKQVESNKSKPRLETIDLVGAFSIESNLRWLFTPRSNYVNNMATLPGTSDGARKSSETKIDCSKQKMPPHMSPVIRRTTSSNNALIEDLSGAKGTHVQRARTVSDADRQSNCSRARKRRVNIEIFDGVKVIATCYIVFGHTLMFFFGAVTDLRFADERMFDITMSVSINTLQVVGLFYIMTGCLLTYFAFTKAKLKQLLNPIFWLLVLLARYCRLLPAYLLVFWFARHVAPLVGSGPTFLEYRTDAEHIRGYCATESWFTMLTMSAADVKIPMDCIPQAWYLSNDFRTLAVLPVYVFIMALNARLGYAAIFATFAVSTYKMVEFLKLASIDYKILLKWQPHVYGLMADRLHDVYTNFYVRMSTYLLGVIVGHLLYLYETRKIKQWPHWFRKYGMKVALTLGAAFFFGPNLISNRHVNQFLPTIDQVDSNKVVLLIPLFKSSMEVAICIVALLLVTGGGFQWLQDLLSNQTMKILSNISYAVFLTHVELMYKLPPFYVESDYWYLFVMAVFFIASSHMVALFVHLIYEMPINNVMRRLVFKRLFVALS